MEFDSSISFGISSVRAVVCQGASSELRTEGLEDKECLSLLYARQLSHYSSLLETFALLCF
jgi:hypothetical protein